MRIGVARRDGQVVAVVPDLICTLNTDTGAPVTTEALAFGQRLTVYAISTPDIMRTPAELDRFGLPEPYTPVEQLTAGTRVGPCPPGPRQIASADVDGLAAGRRR
ncbi:S-methyl thiohydantoin desulfurase domain-containing protein [Nonomuraea dietziae]|uniref:S-methyl thiohydantoin desulfurase domain-containing protein n=1 Tax=Nonomuraea dietziae TaxID=65515 RepID=UPI0033F587F8